jgi:hypothetical protein
MEALVLKADTFCDSPAAEGSQDQHAHQDIQETLAGLEPLGTRFMTTSRGGSPGALQDIALLPSCKR